MLPAVRFSLRYDEGTFLKLEAQNIIVVKTWPVDTWENIGTAITVKRTKLVPMTRAVLLKTFRRADFTSSRLCSCRLSWLSLICMCSAPGHKATHRPWTSLAKQLAYWPESDSHDGVLQRSFSKLEAQDKIAVRSWSVDTWENNWNSDHRQKNKAGPNYQSSIGKHFSVLWLHELSA